MYTFAFPAFILSCVSCLAPYIIIALLLFVGFLVFDTMISHDNVVLVYGNAAGSPPVTMKQDFMRRPLSYNRCHFTAISSMGRPRCIQTMELPTGRLPEEFQLPETPDAGSDVVEALGLAARAFQSNSGSQCFLILAQNCITRQFEGVDPASEPTELLQKLEEEEKIPDLTGVAVSWYFFYDRCDQPGLTAAQRRYARTFWELFFQKANAASFAIRAELPAPVAAEVETEAVKALAE